jgi:hypothetical protein
MCRRLIDAVPALLGWQIFGGVQFGWRDAMRPSSLTGITRLTKPYRSYW